LDDKGRLSIPAKIRPGDPETSRKKGIPAGNKLVVSQGFDGCLSLYPVEEWEKIQNRLQSKSFTLKDFRYVNRLLHQYTSVENIDKSGRIHLPEILRKEAGLSKDVLVIGANQTIEVWDPEIYRSYMKNFGRSLEEVAEGLFKDEPER
jgi:MraZ protein